MDVEEIKQELSGKGIKIKNCTKLKGKNRMLFRDKERKWKPEQYKESIKYRTLQN